MRLAHVSFVAAPHRLIRKYRCYVYPSHWRAFGEVLDRSATAAEDGARKFVYFDLTSPDIDLDGSRYIVTLLREFEAIGYTAAYRRSFPFLSTMRYKRYKPLLFERPYRVVRDVAELPPNSVAAVVTDRRSKKFPGLKTLRISYDIRLPSGPNERLLEFRPYPRLYPFFPKEIDTTSPRPWRVWFAGTINKHWARPLTAFGKMTRTEMIEHLEKILGPNERHIAMTPGDRPAGERFIRPHYWIEVQDWFAHMQQSEFFLACPGGAMPICHNLSEALMMGTVPILEYPEYLDPPLQDGVNCLVFSGRDSLVETVRKAFTLPREQIQKMRGAAMEYWRQHMAPGTFARSFLQSDAPETTLLFNAHLTPRR